jgi:hypothetical protein
VLLDLGEAQREVSPEDDELEKAVLDKENLLSPQAQLLLLLVVLVLPLSWWRIDPGESG